VYWAGNGDGVVRMVVWVRSCDLVERASVQASHVVSLLLPRPAGECGAAGVEAEVAVRAVGQIH
jgi:hypothetical protein